jgi:cytochrome c peroxidase
LQGYRTEAATFPPIVGLGEGDFAAHHDLVARSAIEAASEIGSIEADERDVADVIAFLRSLTDPRAMDLGREVPVRVPSGLPVAD